MGICSGVNSIERIGKNGPQLSNAKKTVEIGIVGGIIRFSVGIQDKSLNAGSKNELPASCSLLYDNKTVKQNCPGQEEV